MVEGFIVWSKKGDLKITWEKARLTSKKGGFLHPKYGLAKRQDVPSLPTAHSKFYMLESVFQA